MRREQTADQQTIKRLYDYSAKQLLKMNVPKGYVQENLKELKTSDIQTIRSVYCQMYISERKQTSNVRYRNMKYHSQQITQLSQPDTNKQPLLYLDPLPKCGYLEALFGSLSPNQLPHTI